MLTKYFVLAFVLAVAIYVTVYGKPKERGYFCDDKTIRFPYSKAPFDEIHVLSAYLLLSSLYIFWTIKGKRKKNRSDIHLYYMWLGLLFLYIFIIVAKYVIGELRPNFLDVCKPIVDCTAHLTAKHRYHYIKHYNCSPDVRPDLIENARLSFPSAHAGITFYFTLYLFIYMENESENIGRSKRLIQVLLITLLLQLNIFRVTHNFSHALDVITGAILGFVFAVIFNSVSVSHTENLCMETAQAPLLK